MILRPLSVILESSRESRVDDSIRDDLERQQLTQPFLELNDSPFPPRDVFHRPWYQTYPTPSTPHCSTVAKDALENAKTFTPIVRNFTPAKRSWDKAFSVPSVEGCSPMDIVKNISAWSLVRQCILMQLYDVNSPRCGSTTSSVAFTESIDTDDESGTEKSDTQSSLPASRRSIQISSLSPFVRSEFVSRMIVCNLVMGAQQMIGNISFCCAFKAWSQQRMPPLRLPEFTAPRPILVFEPTLRHSREDDGDLDEINKNESLPTVRQSKEYDVELDDRGTTETSAPLQEAELEPSEEWVLC